jgi:hypothetical protein
VEGFATIEAIQTATAVGRRELAPVPRRTYEAFLDFASGSGQDSAACAIAHEEVRGGRLVAVLDTLLEVRPPFSPEQCSRDFAELLRAYGIERVTADRFAGEFAVEAMARHGISLWPSERSKSVIYTEFLPHLNSGRVELLDHVRLATQIVGLERRATRGGRDSIDHAPGGHDDVANVVAGVLVEVLMPWARAGGVGHAITDESQGAHGDADLAGTRPSWLDLFRPSAGEASPRASPTQAPERSERRVGRATRMDDLPGGGLGRS